MLVRLIPEQGGDGTTYGIIAMNDTGSDVLTLFDIDMPHLGNTHGYNGWIGQAAILTANGAVNNYPLIVVQVQMVGNGNLPWSNWIDEFAIVKPAIPGILRLSGIGIRDALYIATTPGNNFLAVSATKGRLTSLL
jgi:hypothetical protein